VTVPALFGVSSSEHIKWAYKYVSSDRTVT
jgi:hypothetical protein